MRGIDSGRPMLHLSNRLSTISKFLRDEPGNRTIAIPDPLFHFPNETTADVHLKAV